ncbi:hypothetical protein SLA2020_119590 [Shorea laevis]
MEDVLDEWNTSLLKLHLDEADQKNFSLFKGKVRRPFLSCFRCGQVVQRHDIALKIKDLNERLGEITKDKDRYQLIPREVRQPRRVKSTSFTEVSKLLYYNGKKTRNEEDFDPLVLILAKKKRKECL